MFILSNKIEEIKRIKYFSSEGKRAWFILGIVISFMFSIFGPLELYFTNKKEFWFSLEDLFPVVIIIFIAVSVIILLIGNWIEKKKNSIYILFYFIFLYFFIYREIIYQENMVY